MGNAGHLFPQELGDQNVLRQIDQRGKQDAVKREPGDQAEKHREAHQHLVAPYPCSAFFEPGYSVRQSWTRRRALKKIHFFLKTSTAFHASSGGCPSYSSARSRYILARESSG